MYSQYSYYQNNSASTPQQQQQQQQQQAATTTTTSGVWNGQQWIAQPSAASAPTSYAQAATVTTVPSTTTTTNVANMIIKHGKTHTSLVEHYTTIYHHWNAQSTSAKVALASLPPPHPNTPTNNSTREEMERKEKWASYYAGNSAALAHYHLALSKQQGGGVVQEPYARPASPPVPPQMAGGSAGGVSAVASVAAVTAAVGNAAAAAVTTASPTRKKSRWSTTTTASVPAQVQGGNNNHGKSMAAAAATTTSSLATMEAAAVAKRNNVSSSLYLNKFVQEKSSPGASRSNSNTMGHGFSSQSTNNTNKNTWQASPANGGTKRKLATEDQYNSSSFSSNKESYYGPSPSKLSSFNEDDYVPLALNRSLGSTSKVGSSPLSKKEKKKQKKLLAKKQQGSSPTKTRSDSFSGFNANESTLSERANRFKDTDTSTSTTLSENYDKYMGKSTIGGHSSGKKQLNQVDYAQMTVKGTCTILEKEYLRLTSPPKSELVRPLVILERHLANLKESYYGKEGGNTNGKGARRKVHNGRVRDYNWYCSQFKALRQDLTVQRIINGFAVDVYETHAKIALEEDDLNEYNQSQTQLKELYEKIERVEQGGERRKKNKGGGGLKNRNEFIAYRIIYYVFLCGNRKYDGGSSDIFKIMLQLTPEQRKDECIHHALLVRAAVAESDYHRFFLLQDIAPNMGDYLMDKIVPSVRQSALQRICKAYRPSVPTEFVLKELGFDVHSPEEVEGGRVWMESCGCVFDKRSGMMMTKDCAIVKESTLGGVKNSLI